MFRIFTFPERASTEQLLLKDRKFDRAIISSKQVLFWLRNLFRIKISKEELLSWSTYPCRAFNFFRTATLSTKVLLQERFFFRTAIFWDKKLIFQKSNIPHHLLFHESYFFKISAIFFSGATFPFSCAAILPIYQLLIKWARYQLRAIKAWEFFFMYILLFKRRIMEIIVFLISWLHKVLWNSYLLSELLFQSLYVLGTVIFSKQLYWIRKKIATYDLLFLIAIYPPKMAANISQKIAPEQWLNYKRSFSMFGTHFDDRPKMSIYRESFPILFSLKSVQFSKA